MLKRVSSSIRQRANESDGTRRSSSSRATIGRPPRHQRPAVSEDVVASHPVVDYQLHSHTNSVHKNHRHSDEASIDDNSLFTTSRSTTAAGGGVESSSASIFAPSDASQYIPEGRNNYDTDVWSVNTGLGNDEEDVQQQEQEATRNVNSPRHPLTHHPLEDAREAALQQSYDTEEMKKIFPFPTDHVYLNEFAFVEQGGGADLDFSTLRTDDGIIQEAKGPATAAGAASAPKGQVFQSSHNGTTTNQSSQPRGKVGMWYRTLPAWVQISMWLILLLLVACIILSVTFTLLRDTKGNQSSLANEDNSIRPTAAPIVVGALSPTPVPLSTDLPTLCSDSLFKFVIQSTLWDCATLAVQSNTTFVVQACQVNVSQAYYLCPQTCGLCN